ncbi:MAG: ATP-dependent DNA helicase RecG [Planctomycetota bacterium]
MAGVETIPGCDATLKPLFDKLQIKSVWDLLLHVPRKYQDRRKLQPIAKIRGLKEAVVRGKVLSTKLLKGRARGRSRAEITVSDGSGSFLTAVYFAHAPYFAKAFIPGDEVILFGKVSLYGAKLQLVQPEFDILSPEELLSGEAGMGIIPFYSLTAGLDQRRLRKLIQGALRLAKTALPPTLPARVQEAQKLMGLAEALAEVHAPQSPASLEEAQRRLDFEEAFFMQLGLAARRTRLKALKKARATPAPAKVMERIRSLLPHKPTRAQDRAIKEILGDFAGEAPMNRLLQGDVGCGKTLVAVVTILVKIAAREQVALMAPTEILAQQHFERIQAMLPERRFKMELLTGTRKPAERRAILKGAASGEIGLVVGTHALATSTTSFRNLGLVVIDEQHKFGVLQRASLKRKGAAVDTLVMTATPIPRTLALTLYGDLAVSTIGEMPPGRSPISTKKVHPGHRKAMEKHILAEAQKGRQTFVVCPAAEEDSEDFTAARKTFEELHKGSLGSLRIGLLHGKLGPRERESAIQNFRAGRTDILVATVIVEVGVDIPNATTLVVENAERFGLAQLHQLRGRVGRGSQPGHCFLVCAPKGEDASARISALLRTDDGFKIAEADLELRGAGDATGVRQSGKPGSRLGRLLLNLPLVSEARTAAEQVLARDPLVQRPEHQGCHAGHRLQFAASLNLVSVG